MVAKTYQGNPCFKKHSGERYTANGRCVECQAGQVRQLKKPEGRGILSTIEGRAAGRLRRKMPIPSRKEPVVCECCGVVGKRMHLDHCHTTNTFRGWLCFNCNSAIGKLGDDVAGVSRALTYLVKNQHTAQEITINVGSETVYKTVAATAELSRPPYKSTTVNYTVSYPVNHL